MLSQSCPQAYYPKLTDTSKAMLQPREKKHPGRLTGGRREGTWRPPATPSPLRSPWGPSSSWLPPSSIPAPLSPHHTAARSCRHLAGPGAEERGEGTGPSPTTPPPAPPGPYLESPALPGLQPRRGFSRGKAAVPGTAGAPWGQVPSWVGCLVLTSSCPTRRKLSTSQACP